MREDVGAGAGRWRRLVPAAVVAVAPLLLFSDATTGRVLLAPGDSIAMTLPSRQLVAAFLRAGEWPLWNPFVFSGFPMLAVSQMAVLHPGTWLYLVLPELWATNVQVLAAYVAAGLATYAYCRAIACSRVGAMLGGLTFAGSGFMLAHLGHVVIIQAAPCLPALLWCLERQRAAAQWRFVAGGALAVALAVFAGHPQIPVMVLAAGAAYALYGLLGDPAPAGRRAVALAAAATLAGGLLLAAAQLVPMPELIAQSPRAHLTFAEFASMALPLRQLPTLLLPYLFGGEAGQPYRGAWNFFELCPYLGLVPTMLALAAVPGAARDRAGRFWLLLGGVALLLMLGAQTPLARLAYHVPVWNLFRGAGRNVLYLNLAVAVLAAWGATHARPHAIVAGAGGVVAAVVATAGLARVTGVPATPAQLLWPVLLAVIGAAALLAAVRWPGAATSAAVTAALAADLYAFGAQMDHILLPARFLGQPPDYVTWLLAEGVQPQRGRLLHLHAGDFLATRGDLARWRLASVTGYEPLMLSRYGEFAGQMTFFGSVSDRAVVESPLFLDLLNTTHLVVELPDPARVAAAGGFAPQAIGADLGAGQGVTLTLPRPAPARVVELVTSLSAAPSLADDALAGRVVVTGADGRTVTLPLRAGRDTAEWAWARPDVAAVVRHRQPPPWEPVTADGFTGSRYRARLSLPAPMAVAALRVEGAAPGAVLSLVRASLRDGDTVTPLTYAHALLGDDGRWQRLRTGEQTLLLRNRRALPRTWLVPAARTLDGAAVLAAVRSGHLPDGSAFDPRALALVEGAAPAALGPADPAARATLREWGPNALSVETESAAPALLVTSEIDYPGWRARLDGAPVPILRTDGVLRGVAVPAGAHRVDFAFRPWLALVGALISLATAVAFAVVGVWRGRRATGVAA